MECIPFESEESMSQAVRKMLAFQRMHNKMIKEINALFSHTESNMSNSDLAPVLVRCLYREFLSLVEADLNLLNHFNPYPGYIEMARLMQKFKKTYRHHASTFLKQQLHIKYKSASFEQFITVKEHRNEFTHPKAAASLSVDETHLTLIKSVFVTYTDHINALMTDIGVSTHTPYCADNGKAIPHKK